MSHTILLVEDDANIRQMLSIALGAEGYLCVEAASVREALSLFKQATKLKTKFDQYEMM